MILSGNEIRDRLGRDVVIDPFDEAQLNPNSYNLRLHDELLAYEEIVLDMRRPNRFRRHTIPPEGIVLDPNRLYLGRTMERTETHNLVPMLEGRSSIGRLGLFVHVTAGFGDVGFCGYWTLEMFAVQPVRIYPGVQICQIFYHTIEGDVTEYHSEKYQNNRDIQPSLLFKELESLEDRQMRLGLRPGTGRVTVRLQKVTSGGQTGVDRAALDVAMALNIPCGGFCPRGRRAEDGRLSPRYPLTETTSPSYSARTIQNVADSDGTLILTVGRIAGGTLLTRNTARKRHKPCLVVDLNDPPAITEVSAWLKEHAIRVLNVAGPREARPPRYTARRRVS